jgi:hypothetical protein
MGNSLNLTELDQEQALNLAKFYVRSNKNVFFFGRRGTGKTEIAIQAIQECGYKVNALNLTVLDRTDLLGLPSIFDNGEVVQYKAPAFLPTLAVGAKPDTVLLLDEIDKCHQDLTSPLLEILKYRQLNGRPLNIVSCILTGNLPNEHVFSNQLSSAILDRGAKYVLTFDLTKWLEWARAHRIHDLIIGFLSKHADLACGKIEDTCYASPSPRSWTLASEAIFQAKEWKMVDIESITQILAGFVGLQASVKFKVWYEAYRRFDPFVVSLIESGKMTLNFQSLEITERIVFAIAACQHAKLKTLETKPKTKFPYLENLCRFFQEQSVDPEVKTLALSNAFTFEMITEHGWYKSKMFFDLFSKMTENFGIK